MQKDPAAVKDYGFDWSAWMSSGDVVSSSVFSAGTCVVTSSSISSYTTVCFIGSGTAGEIYKVTNRISTAQGRIDERSFDLNVINL
jgi:hypothetical protein